MSRLATVNPNQLQGDQKIYHEQISTFTKNFAGDTFITQRDDGALIGPFGALLHTPDVGRQFFAVTASLGKLNGLPLQAREIAILVVGAKFKAAYELYAHSNVALKKTETSQQTVQQILEGRRPESLGSQDAIAYDVAKWLVERPGPLDRELWERAVEGFGEEGAIALVHYVGYYCYTCTILNGFDVQVP